MPTLDQRIINATRPEMARTRSLIADRYVSPTEWDALVHVVYYLGTEEMPCKPQADPVDNAAKRA